MNEAKYKITSKPKYEYDQNGKLRIGIPEDWNTIYECGIPYGNDVCHEVFPYESDLRDHMSRNHHMYLKRKHLSRSKVEIVQK